MARKEERDRREDRREDRRNGDGRGAPRQSSEPWRTGSDASYIEPKLIPDDELLGRDDSGGPDWDPHTADWDDGGYVTGGAKAHLSARGGREASKEGDEESNKARRRAD